MPRSAATTVEQYLRELPKERREVVSAVRDVIRRHLPKGYRETMSWGSISYELPLERYPKTYNGQPLCYAGLAAQKSHYALYLMGCYMDPARARRLEQAFQKAGKKLDMGKSCLRFKRLEDLPLDAIGEIIGGMPPEDLIAQYERARAGAKR